MLNRFTLEINEFENAAFDEEPTDELARILENLAAKVRSGSYLSGGKLFDINGNSVGQYSIWEE